jgi:nucleosome-remodeling factor subunit BPTF
MSRFSTFLFFPFPDDCLKCLLSLPKFYVGCDVCNDWFHGGCVGITEEMSKTMSEFVCEACRSAKDNQEIYCLCKQPYDESQFYIGCERCADWFHGRCVGILQAEADRIDEYLCPRCDSSSKLNLPNNRPLTKVDLDLIKKLTKQIVINRNSWPFKHPVDQADVPNYYKVVKEPMDLTTVENRVGSGHYTKLCQFVGDVMRIFENCRYFNQPNTQIMKCAEGLESFFAQKLALLRVKMADPNSSLAGSS